MTATANKFLDEGNVRSYNYMKGKINEEVLRGQNRVGRAHKQN